MKLKSTIAVALMALLISACSGGGTVPSPVAPVPPKGGSPSGMSFSMPIYGISSKTSANKTAADVSQPVGSVVSNVNSDGSVNSTATSLSGTTLATASVVRNGDGTATARVHDELGSQTITTLDPAAIRVGNNTLPQGGTLYVDGNTNVVTAQVTSPSGTNYTVTATPNSDNTYTLSVIGSDGSQWQQKMAMPSAAGTQTASAKHAMFACQVAKDAAGYFGSVSMIAGGIAILGGGPVALGVSGVTGIIGGGAWVLGWANGCPM